MTGAEPPRWVVNRYRPRYLSELVRIHRDCFPEPWPAETFAASIAMSGSFCLCLSDAGNPTAVPLRGFVLYRTAADEAEILTIATERDCRRSGAVAWRRSTPTGRPWCQKCVPGGCRGKYRCPDPLPRTRISDRGGSCRLLSFFGRQGHGCVDHAPRPASTPHLTLRTRNR